MPQELRQHQERAHQRHAGVPRKRDPAAGRGVPILVAGRPTAEWLPCVCVCELAERRLCMDLCNGCMSHSWSLSTPAERNPPFQHKKNKHEQKQKPTYRQPQAGAGAGAEARDEHDKLEREEHDGEDEQVVVPLDLFARLFVSVWI